MQQHLLLALDIGLTDLTDVNGTLFFVEYKNGLTYPVLFGELWKSDGTRAGTTFVADIDPTTDKQCIGYPLTPFQGKVVFPLQYALCQSDGTSAGIEFIWSESSDDPKV